MFAFLLNRIAASDNEKKSKKQEFETIRTKIATTAINNHLDSLLLELKRFLQANSSYLNEKNWREFLQKWLMDPLIDEPMNATGKWDSRRREEMLSDLLRLNFKLQPQGVVMISRTLSVLAVFLLLLTSCTTTDSGSPTGPTEQPEPNPPIAEFTYSIQVTDSTISTIFSNMSSNATEYLWSFGDGTYSTDQSPSHSYDSLGYYDVQLIAIGTGKDTTSETIVLDRKPVASFEGVLSNARAPSTITISNNSTGARSYRWKVIDMESIFPTTDSTLLSTESEPSFTVRSWGSFSVMLIATSIVLKDTAYKSLELTRPNDVYLDSIVVLKYPRTDTAGRNWDLQYYGDPYFVIGDKDASIILADSINHQSMFLVPIFGISFEFNSLKLGSIEEYYYLSLFDYDNGESVFGSSKDEDYSDDFIFNLTLDLANSLGNRNLPESIVFDYTPNHDIKAEVYISYR